MSTQTAESIQSSSSMISLTPDASPSSSSSSCASSLTSDASSSYSSSRLASINRLKYIHRSSSSSSSVSSSSLSSSSPNRWNDPNEWNRHQMKIRFQLFKEESWKRFGESPPMMRYHKNENYHKNAENDNSAKSDQLNKIDKNDRNSSSDKYEKDTQAMKEEHQQQQATLHASASSTAASSSSSSSPSFASDIQRLDGLTLSSTKFHAQYEQNRIPCIIRNLSNDWSMSEWTIESLSSNQNKYANVKFKVDEQLANQHNDSEDQMNEKDDDQNDHDDDNDDTTPDEDPNETQSQSPSSSSSTFKLSLSDFMYYLHHNDDDVPLYIFDAIFDIDPVGCNILNEYTVPSYFTEDLFSYLGEVRRPPYRWLLIGPERSGSSLHIDPLATSAWNTCIDGVKRWSVRVKGLRSRDVNESGD